jgi:hypothetical protein
MALLVGYDSSEDEDNETSISNEAAKVFPAQEPSFIQYFRNLTTSNKHPASDQGRTNTANY